MKNELSALYKVVNKYIKQDYAKYKKYTIETYTRHAGSTKKAFKTLRSCKKWIESLQNNGTDIRKRSDIITEATEFYKNLYSSKSQPTAIPNISSKNNTDNSITPIDEAEVIETIKRLKVDKCPGSDGITNEALKTANILLAGPLTVLFNRILRQSKTPSQWFESNIILIIGPYI